MSNKQKIKMMIIAISGPAVGGPLSWLIAPQIAATFDVDIKHISFLIMIATGAFFAIILRGWPINDNEEID